jgi:hypothetical protein
MNQHAVQYTIVMASVEMALASTLCAPEGVRVCCEQTGSIPRHGRVGRGRE